MESTRLKCRLLTAMEQRSSANNTLRRAMFRGTDESSQYGSSPRDSIEAIALVSIWHLA